MRIGDNMTCISKQHVRRVLNTWSCCLLIPKSPQKHVTFVPSVPLIIIECFHALVQWLVARNHKKCILILWSICNNHIVIPNFNFGYLCFIVIIQIKII